MRSYLKPFLVFDREEESSITRKIIKESNPHSSTQYTSIQLTARQMIVIQDPFNFNISYRFFFPFEIQILDWESYMESRTGRASHNEYKKSQTTAVRNRVLGNVLAYCRRKGTNGQCL